MAPLADIYEELRRLRPKPHPQNFDAIIRRTLENNSSDSDSYSGTNDLFYSVDGIGGGVWGLRSALEYTPIAFDVDLPSCIAKPSRQLQETYRILRDTNLARQLKLLHQHTCQMCDWSIQLPNGNGYAEAHHIKLLSKPHNGPDIAKNVIVLCPNHHVMLDYGVIQLDLEQIKAYPKHQISLQFINYHNEVIHGQAANK